MTAPVEARIIPLEQYLRALHAGTRSAPRWNRLPQISQGARASGSTISSSYDAAVQDHAQWERDTQGRLRRVTIGRFGILTVDQAAIWRRSSLGPLPPEKILQTMPGARNEMNVAELCDRQLTEAREGSILGRRNRPIKSSPLDVDEIRIRTHIKPLLGKRIARQLTIADVEAMQTDMLNGRTGRERSGGRGGKATGGPGVAARCVGTLHAILGHAKHKGLLAEHPTKGAKKLAGRKRTRRLSTAEIEALRKAMAYAERNVEALPLHLPPYLAHAVDLEVGVEHAPDLGLHRLIALGTW